jgi:glycosyltransferase involved in cell wall biosynthesis
MIGPVHREHFRPPRARNVLYTGPMAYADLPEALRRFDVAMLPFACNELTLDTHPTKTLEYLASGRPTVSTAIPDIVEYYGDAIAIAHSHEEFLAHCARAIEHPETFAAARGIEIARAMTWDRVVAEMEERLEALVPE